jgi:diaminohydroxyphosphoribosylaminopyrimidine deaminase/5-amino-6-(5-phosphoribosylamino)uracil reductase
VEQFLDKSLSYINFSSYMQDAIVAALNSEPYPNPKVGAVLVSKNGTIKSIGVHKGPGTNHAELEIINNSKISSEDTLYVTLEPCFHTDSSPSCAEELLKTPLKNIVIGDIDLDDRTKGKSIELLKKSNINVHIEKNANGFLNPHYRNQKLSTSKATLIGKIATSQNNYIYEDNSSGKYITNDISLSITHYLRASVDAIAVGKNTLIADEPLLNVRNTDVTNIQPQKIVFWGSDKNVENVIKKYHDFIFLTSFDHNANNILPLLNDKFNLNDVYMKLGINSLLVEGGNFLHNYLLSVSEYDYFYWFKSDNEISNGVPLEKSIIDRLDNEYKLINKFPLKDNQLTTYTYI